MTAPVAVLAVMERAGIRLDASADHYDAEGMQDTALGYVGMVRELIEARAAVAELIEADKAYDAAKRQCENVRKGARVNPAYRAACLTALARAEEARAAAIARVQP